MYKEYQFIRLKWNKDEVMSQELEAKLSDLDSLDSGNNQISCFEVVNVTAHDEVLVLVAREIRDAEEI